MEFELRDKDLKQYSHFDQLVSKAELTALATSPDRVVSHSFWPFLSYAKVTHRFRRRNKAGNKPPPKRRPIRYAARTDAAIFIYYRFLLAQRYEERLRQLGIAHVPTAYRNIPKSDEKIGGKCNIDFAHEAFSEIRRQGDCVAVTLDISSYFDNIDHRRLRRVWCDLLGDENLPEDHYRVFKAITAYTWVDREQLYLRLGIKEQYTDEFGNSRLRYTMPYRDRPKQLCTPAEFRELVAGTGERYSSLISAKNTEHGIPQGAPLSDLLANAYLLEFDLSLNRYAEKRGGRVWRYSDDIIMILPGGIQEGTAARDFIMREIGRQGPKLEIKESKTALGQFRRLSHGGQSYEHLEGTHGKNGLNYLGFRFDGKRVFLRDSTVTNFKRKITYFAKISAHEYLLRYRGKARGWMIERFHSAQGDFERRFGRVENFEEKFSKKDWTFWTYALRADGVFSDFESKIIGQISGYRKKVRINFQKQLDRLLER